MAWYLPATVVLIAFLIARKALSFAQNIRLAHESGLPYTFSPVTELETWAYLTDPLLRRLCRQYLIDEQKGWPRWARFMIKDWMYEDKYRAHQELGDRFLVVSPGGIICYVADADAAMDVCLRRRDFIKPREKMKMIEPFGANVVSSEGDLWKLHFRVTAPPFGDAANQLVWTETKRQTSALREAWAKGGVQTLKSDIYSVGVNVMASAGFGRPQEWQREGAVPPIGHSLSLLNSIFGIVTYLPLILLLPKWILKRACAAAYVSYVEFEKFMREFISEEKDKLSNNDQHEEGSRGNLLTAMLATNAMEQKAGSGAIQGRASLTDDEILGNIFMFFMAGYDTTANTIIFSCVAMALYPESQDKVIEELDRLTKISREAGRDELSYDLDFPQFRYVIAFLYEVLRVFPVVLPIGRVTSGPTTLKSPSKDTKTTSLPANCGVVVNITGIHYNPSIWNKPHVFSPERWLSPNANNFDPETARSSTDSGVRIPNHTRGTFLTFSEGPRACLGKRFAQAEYVGFFAEVLKTHRIELAAGVDRVAVETLFRSCSAGSPITLAPPADVKLQLVAR